MTKKRIKELRRELRLEQISYGELHEIQCASEYAGIEITDEMFADDLLDALEGTRK